MKILHLIPTLNKGGAERIVLDMCIELVRQKHEVKLVALHPENQYEFLTQSLDYTVVETQVELSLWRKNRVDVSALQQMIDAFQPDVIHSHLFEAEMNLTFCTFSEHTKRIIHFHDNMIQMERFNLKTFTNKKKLTNWYERKLVLKSLPIKTVAIGISKDSIQYIRYNLADKINAQFLHNAIDLHRFDEVSKNKKNTGNLVMVGSLIPVKGHQLALQTMVELKSRNINSQLIIIGDGSLRTTMEDEVRNLNLKDLVLFKGMVDQPEVIVSNSSIFLHTSFSEAFGLVLVEAMACGLPVVCTDGKGNRDLIHEGENGFMIWERDPKLLADKVQFLLENETERQRMGENAHRFAQQFGMEAYVDRLLNAYRDL